MKSCLVEYSGEIKSKVDSFDKFDNANKVGSYWDNVDDKELGIVKKYIKEHYIRIQDFTCAYCKQRIEVKHNGIWDIEHIIPKDKYPKFMFSPLNLCVSCKDCNQQKSNKNILKNKQRKTLPTETGDYLIIHPHLDDYSKHMKILKSSLFFIPLDSKGKETIEVCGLLRFVFQFSDYGDVSVEVSQKISELSSELIQAESKIEKHFILSCIGDVVERGKEIARKEVLNNKLAQI